MPEFLDLHGRTSKALRDVVETTMRRHGLHAGQDLVLALLWEQDGRTPGELGGATTGTTASSGSGSPMPDAPFNPRSRPSGSVSRRRSPRISPRPNASTS